MSLSGDWGYIVCPQSVGWLRDLSPSGWTHKISFRAGGFVREESYVSYKGEFQSESFALGHLSISFSLMNFTAFSLAQNVCWLATKSCLTLLQPHGL